MKKFQAAHTSRGSVTSRDSAGSGGPAQSPEIHSPPVPVKSYSKLSIISRVSSALYIAHVIHDNYYYVKRV